MKVINVRNVNHALNKGVELILNEGIFRESRNGNTIEVDETVCTVYEKPQERVLLNRTRDANPFFHLMESIWMLAGREDVRFLSEFNSNISNYSDGGIRFNGAYGYRLRSFWQDQLKSVITMLKENPDSRQAVCQIWDQSDLNKRTKDKPCNLTLVFRIRTNGKLDMIVYNRSNDMIWGAYGANAVHFSIIQEYVAASLNIPMGTYTQVSNSFHVYTGEGLSGKKWNELVCYHSDNFHDGYASFVQNTEHIRYDQIHHFNNDVKKLFTLYNNVSKLSEIHIRFLIDGNEWESDYFKNLIVPMLSVYVAYKRDDLGEALNICKNITADDWRIACITWLTIRIENRDK